MLVESAPQSLSCCGRPCFRSSWLRPPGGPRHQRLSAYIDGFIKPDFSKLFLLLIDIFDAMVADQVSVQGCFRRKVSNGLHRECASGMLISQLDAFLIKGHIVIVDIEIVQGHPAKCAPWSKAALS